MAGNITVGNIIAKNCDYIWSYSGNLKIDTLNMENVKEFTIKYEYVYYAYIKHIIGVKCGCISILPESESNTIIIDEVNMNATGEYKYGFMSQTDGLRVGTLICNADINIYDKGTINNIIKG